MRIVVLDTVYPEFLKTFPFKEGSYDERLQQLLEYSFGTFDAYSRHLQAEGWETLDIVANSGTLQYQWAAQHIDGNCDLPSIAISQIHGFRPDVLFLQDLSFFSVKELAHLKQSYVLAGQCSCAMPDPEKVRQFDIIFTSLPNHLQRFADLGVKGVYLPLAFDPIVLERAEYTGERDIDVSFVGGVGRHWKRGLEVLEHVAANIPTFQWYGYGVEHLGSGSALRKAYRGEAWGLEYYRLLQRSKIVLNRHGEIAEGYANNLRLFEATGCGALLVTENAPNLSDFFEDRATYVDAESAVDNIKWYLGHPKALNELAGLMQEQTLTQHTYAQRIPFVSAVLKNYQRSAA